jgi:hypothetical protein
LELLIRRISLNLTEKSKRCLSLCSFVVFY